jgi:alpha-amylase/alpha-mannosidase (GH57 family)
MERYVCIHGHFYQPPRENPWLEAIELQDSASPYHDWNERITAECYAPNRSSRIMDAEERILTIVNNYSRISFNFGPTLLAWLEEKHPYTYQCILSADQESQRSYSGHGSALAQAYSHMIMPLANSRDKETQIIWGIEDFVHRFGRKPEGMWLPETAVDLETLQLLADHGILFTILAPDQARRVRRLGSRSWKDVSGGRIDPSQAYRLRLASDQSIHAFFYDGPVSHAIAFERLLAKGEYLAQRLLGTFSEARNWPQLAHVATDGETYGHHFQHGDMALAYALHYIDSNNLARLTNYGEFLEKHPATHQAQVFENSSWSCVHGVERWRSNCGCNSGGNAGWNQEWRAPLRQALDWLRDDVARPFEQEARKYVHDPWRARNDYIHVVLDRSPESVEGFFERNATHPLNDAERVTALKLMELQRHAMLMYTSCGWFFDELSGIETVQVIQYAGRALQLAEELFGNGREEHFLGLLEAAKSNIPEHQNGRVIYGKFVKPAMVDLLKAGAHYAVSSLFGEYGKDNRIYCFEVERQDYKLLGSGRVRLALGRAKITSVVTLDSDVITFGVLHQGDHEIRGGVRSFQNEEAYQATLVDVEREFAAGDVAVLTQLIESHFGSNVYSLGSLFRDDQRRVLRDILDAALAEAEKLYRKFYEHHSGLLLFVSTLGIPLPHRFNMAAEVILNLDMQRSFQSPAMDIEMITRVVREARELGIVLDVSTAEYLLRERVDSLAIKLVENPEDMQSLAALASALEVVPVVPFEVHLWKPQNIVYQLLKSEYPRFLERVSDGDESAQAWLLEFALVAEKLRVYVPRIEGEAE